MKTIITGLFFFMFINLCGQNYIGLHKDSIESILKKTEKSFRLDNSTVNKVYKYLKYVDRINEQTWLFFLDSIDICTHHKLMSDYLNYNETVAKLNDKYEMDKKNSWKFVDQGKTYAVTLTEGEWYFTVLTKEFKQ